MKLTCDLGLTSAPHHLRGPATPPPPGGTVLTLTGPTLPPEISFSRPGPARAWSAAQLLTAYAADTPRFDHTPLTGAALGLLAEAAQTGQLNGYSEDLATWAANNSTVTANTGTAPDGAPTADTVGDNGSGGTGQVFVRRNVIATSGVEMRLSVYLKADQLSWAYIQTNEAGNPACWFNLSDGTVGTNGMDHAEIEELPNGWYKCSVWYVPGSSGNVQFRIGPAEADNNDTVDRDGTSSILAWGAQGFNEDYGDEQGSYISSAGSTTARAADSPLITGLSGTYDVTFTFDDDSTQTWEDVPLGGAGWWPGDANRFRVKQIEAEFLGFLPDFTALSDAVFVLRPSAAETLFEDTAGTDPAEASDGIARISSLVGSGAFTQSGASLRPVWDGANKLTHDGGDDFLGHTDWADFGTRTSDMRLYVVFRVAGDRFCLFSGHSVTSTPFVGLAVDGVAAGPGLQSGSGASISYRKDDADISPASRGDLYDAFSDGNWHIAEVRNIDMTTADWNGSGGAALGVYQGASPVQRLEGDLGTVILLPTATAEIYHDAIMGQLASDYGVTIT